MKNGGVSMSAKGQEKGERVRIRYAVLDVKDWPIFIAATDRGVCRVHYPPEKDIIESMKTRFDCIEDRSYFAGLKREFEEYLAGRRKGFSAKVDFIWGTKFQKKVWNALLRIPYGETRSYQDIARAVGCPDGCRAVGIANRSNPVPLIVPCHRVIGKDGSMTGYGGNSEEGKKRKRYLLTLEGALPK